MNKNINLCELLKGHEGETFYSPLFGKVTFIGDYNNDQYPIRVIIKEDYSEVSFTSDGRFHSVYSHGECLLFPSKDQRDWNKWAEEQKPKVPKTWSKFIATTEDTPQVIYGIVDVFWADGRDYSFTNHDSSIEKSSLALMKIHQLIEVGYGGNITNKEWEDDKQEKYVIGYNRGVIMGICYNERNHVAFHTEQQRDEFLSYPENVQLVKDFYMI